MKKHQSGINTWYQLKLEDTLLKCVLFLVSSPSNSKSKSSGKIFLAFYLRNLLIILSGFEQFFKTLAGMEFKLTNI